MEEAAGNENEYSYLVSERDFVSLLIDLYRNRPVLWKVAHKSYADKVVRAQALDEITKELQTYKPDFTAEKVKKKINIIRTNFNKEKHRVEKWRAQGKSNAKPGLWYFNELLFLDEQDLPEASPYLRVSGVSSIASGDAAETAELSDSSDHKAFEGIEVTPKKRPKVTKFRNISVKRQKIEVDPETEKETDDNQELEQYMTVTTTYYKKPKKREDVLAETWAMKLKKMSPQQKIFAEKIINDVLYEGELGNLSKNCVSFNPL